MKLHSHTTRYPSLLGAAVFTSLALVGAAQGGAQRGTVHVTAKLSSGLEAPKPHVQVKSASGGFTASFARTKKGYTMSWHLTYGKLSGKASSAYIHKGSKGKYGPALFQLCAPCKSGSHGTAYASPSEVDLVLRGQTYVNVRTKKNPTGEIRGQLLGRAS
jgi:hypothetical protein